MTLAYGVCIGTEAKYERYAKLGLSAHAPGAPVLLRRQQRSIFEAYNSIMAEARAISGLTGLVLLHEDVELRSPIDANILEEFRDPTVAIVGAIGGRGLRSVSWSRAKERFGRAPDSFYGDNDFGGGSHDVDIVDGLLLALSPWAVQNLTFDEGTFRGFHAYDADICMQARAAGYRVRVTNLDLFHHTKGGFGDIAQYRRFDDLFRLKWGLPLDGRVHRFTRRLRGLPY